MPGRSLDPGYILIVKSFKLQASENQDTSGKLQAPSGKPQAGLDNAVALGYSGIMKDIKELPITLQMALAIKMPELFNKEHYDRLMKVKNVVIKKMYKEYVKKRSN